MKINLKNEENQVKTANKELKELEKNVEVLKLKLRKNKIILKEEEREYSVK